MKQRRIAFIMAACCALSLFAAPKKIYWGNEVPAGWNGSFSSELLTIPEKTRYERTTSSLEALEFINRLRW